MKNSHGKRIIQAILTFLMLFVAVGPFVDINELKKTLPLILYILTIVCFMLGLKLWPKLWYLWTILMLGSLTYTDYQYYNHGVDLFTQSFFGQTFTTLRNELNEMAQAHFNYVSEPVGLIIVLLVVILIVWMAIIFEHWQVPFIIILIYLISVSVFNNEDLLKEMLMLVVFAALFAYSDQLSRQLIAKPKRFMGIMLAALAILLIPLVISANYKTWLQTPHAVIQSTGVGFRNYLNTVGLYDRVNSYGEGPNSQTGYSEDDTNLGGPVADNETVVFTALQAEDHYWKVENKDEYTGRGWINASKSKGKLLDTSPVTLTDDELNQYYTKNTRENITFIPQEEMRFLPVPYGRTVWDASDALLKTKQLVKDTTKNKYLLESDGKGSQVQINLTSYDLQYDTAQLKKAGKLASDENMVKRYTQLPAKLPKRVSKLAKKIVGKTTNSYTMAIKIERYLSETGGFTYSKIDAKVTPKNRDYVDYFLFETKLGYCDNFSSAMVVLMRSLGVPTRWAKGYNVGERGESVGNNQYRYTIRNTNAHSWPEVYFPSVGWIPFEPTASFTNPVSQSAEEVAASSASSSSISSSAVSSSSSSADSSSSESSSSQSNKAKAASSDVIRKGDNSVLKIVLIGLVLILIVLGIIFRHKLGWMSRQWYCQHFGSTNFNRAYRLILVGLEHQLPRSNGESLITYAKRISEAYPKVDAEFTALTTTYQARLFGEPIEQGSTIDYSAQLVALCRIMREQ